MFSWLSDLGNWIGGLVGPSADSAGLGASAFDAAEGGAQGGFDIGGSLGAGAYDAAEGGVLGSLGAGAYDAAEGGLGSFLTPEMDYFNQVSGGEFNPMAAVPGAVEAGEGAASATPTGINQSIAPGEEEFSLLKTAQQNPNMTKLLTGLGLAVGTQGAQALMRPKAPSMKFPTPQAPASLQAAPYTPPTGTKASPTLTGARAGAGAPSAVKISQGLSRRSPNYGGFSLGV